MSVLVVYYTRSGNTETIAEKVAKELDADIVVIRESKPYRGWIGYLQAGFQAVTGKPVGIQSTLPKKPRYDIIVMGSPVWAGNMPPPVRTYLINNRNKFREYGLFCTEGRSGGDTMFKKQSELLGKPPVSVLEITEKQMKENNYNRKIQEFVNVLQKREKKLTSSKPAKKQPKTTNPCSAT